MNASQLDLIGMVVAEMPRSLAFYRQLGFEIPAEADTEPHVEISLPNGLRLAWDSIDEVRTFDPDHEAPPWRLEHGARTQARRAGIGRRDLRPARHRRLPRPQSTVGRPLGPALRHGPRPRRQLRRSLRPMPPKGDPA